MVPLFPFAAGLLAGAIAIKLWRKDSTRAQLSKAQEKLRQATVSGLSAIEHSSAAMREKLVVEPQPEAAAEAPRKAKPRAKPATKATRQSKAKVAGS